ncbi:GNAT family N-acetyltransferase [bacterium]|nr:GNAT family N-acetyltransferase [bacterium]
MNNYIRRLASQHARKNISKTYVAVCPGNPQIYGFYSLSTGSIILADLPEAARRKLPAYPIPTAHLGQLSVDRCVQGQGLGAALLFDALRRSACVSEELGIYAVTVNALDHKAKSFYAQYGFVEIIGDPMHLYLEMKVISHLL